MLLSSVILISCTNSNVQGPITPPSENSSIPGQAPLSGNATPAALLDIKSFKAEPKHVRLGENTTLVWNVVGATVLSIEPFVGHVSGNTGGVFIAPKETTLYVLKASDGLIETTARFLVIVKTADGSIIWPNSGTDNATTQSPYEGWTYYPNKYVEWKISDSLGDYYSDSGLCWQLGYITNNHSEWMMTDLTINNRLILTGIFPGSQRGYTTSMDCKQLPELKWKWRVYQ